MTQFSVLVVMPVKGFSEAANEIVRKMEEINKKPKMQR